MKELQPDAYALLEANFNDLTLRHDKQPDDETETESVFSSQPPTPLEPPGPLNGAESGLPPTPPTNSQDGQSTQHLSTCKSSLSTPVNARSPPTPDASPPRTASSSNTAAERPNMFAYPSSRAESFMTAREDPLSSEPSESGSITPLGDRLSTVEEDRGLGLAFEHGDNDITPTEHVRPVYQYPHVADTTAGADEDKETPPAVDMVETASPSPSPRPRRTSGLRERVEASTNSPVTPSIDTFAQSIGWPSEDKDKDKRNSASSMGSTVVEAKIIVTPPRTRQTLRHSGKNMAYRDEASPTPARASRRHSNRQSSQPDEPLHRLVHKRVALADRSKRISADSDTLGTERSMSSPLSFRSRIIDSSAATLAHQESLRNVLQPAADILSRSSCVTRPYHIDRGYHKRMSSAPEPVRTSALSATPRAFSQLSPPTSPRRAANVTFQTSMERTSPIQSPVPSVASPRSLKRRQRSNVAQAKQAADVNKSLPEIPPHDERDGAEQDVFLGASGPAEDARPPSALLERVRQLVAAREATEEAAPVESKESPPSPEHSRVPTSPEQPRAFSPAKENSPPFRQGSRSSPGRSGERRRSSLSQERASISPSYPIRPSLDRPSTEEIGRRSHEWRRPSEEHGRVSFDRSTMRTEEYGNARHLYASTTPFSQFSDTPVEISEATQVCIIPHNNTSLLVVQQQPSRVTSMVPEQRQVADEAYLSPNDYRDIRSTPTPPFVDASEEYIDEIEQAQRPQQPTLNFEPSTPPLQIALPQPGAVDSPLKNPRPPPEPPKINFIPPTPAEELEKQLVPGPPKRSDSHPQRRLSLVQRARRYSDNLIPTLLSRGTSNRNRDTRRSHHRNEPHDVPTVTDEAGTLHPFWRPRGFWDDFTDSESEDEGLHPGGDTSDVETLPEAPKRSNTLGKKLTSWRGSGGFLIGNSLGVERHGTNKRRHHVTLPPNFPRSPRTVENEGSLKILIQPPTQPLGSHGNTGIRKSGSRASLKSYEFPRRGASWRNGKKYQVQYIGLSGVKQRFRERAKEKRREKIRQSIGSRYYVEPSGPNAA